MRRHIAVELDHDLRVVDERNVAWISTPAPAADEREQRLFAREADEPEAGERLIPDAEQIAELQLRRTPHLDHTGRRPRPRVVAAAAGDADPPRDDHDA